MGIVVDGWVNMPQLTEEAVAENPLLTSVSEFFGSGPELLARRTPAQVLETMDAAGVDCGLLACAMGSQGGGALGNLMPTFEAGLEACEASNGRLRLMVGVNALRDIVGACRDLREVAAREEVAACLVGVAGMQIPLTDRRLYPIYATCRDLELPVVSNVGILGPPMPSKYQHPLLLEEILCDFPGLIVVAAHMGHPWERLLVRLMMKFPTLYLMTSAYLPKYIHPAVIEFMGSRRGAGRVLFASDWPVITPERALEEARKLPLAAEVLDGYLGENLLAAFGWKAVTSR